MHIVYHQRRKRVARYFSIENSFEAMRRHLPSSLSWAVAAAPEETTGPGPMLANILSARRSSGAVHHITGDIHYVAFALPKGRLVLTIHDCGYRRRLSGLKRWLMHWLWYRAPCARAAAVTAVSEFTKSELVACVGVRAEKIHVIPTCISPAFVRSDRAFNGDRPRILHIGTAENKNLVRLAAALAGLACELRVIGPLGHEQREALEAAGVEYSTAMNLSGAQLVAEYVESDVVAFVSTYEGFGMPILEANTVGRPVVTSNLASMPEVGGGAVCLVDPFDVVSIRAGLDRVIRDRPYRERLVAAGYENAMRFRPEEVARSYARLYQDLTHGGSAEPAR